MSKLLERLVARQLLDHLNLPHSGKTPVWATPSAHQAFHSTGTGTDQWSSCWLPPWAGA